MELLNEQVTNSKCFETIQEVIKNHYINRNNLNPIISYNEFKNTLIVFVEKIMTSLLENTEFSNDKCSCVVKNLPSYSRGEFDPEDNEITINEEVINDIYSGKITSMTTIFHELNHFKSEYDIKLGRINKDIIRSIKERILRDYCYDELTEIKTIKTGANPFIIDNYYKCNYVVFSEEKTAEINAINNLISFVELTGIELSEQDLQQLKDEIKNNITQYNNYLRDLRMNINFNNYFLDFEEAFDVIIKQYPYLLSDMPQLNIEYYINDNGEVVRRTKEELEERLTKETDNDIIEYIKYLLSPNNEKTLSKTIFDSNDLSFNNRKKDYDIYNTIRNRRR